MSAGTGNKGGGRHMPTGVSDEAYDLITTLSNKLQEMWRIDEFLGDSKRGDRQIWETIREHDRADVEQLAQALKRSLSQGGQ
ncbi:MAG TPA: hypothetical protein VM536_11020 [Chloroflexia bacterium]|nr:hypothetical protein [Chloroflexia bacterium]